MTKAQRIHLNNFITVLCEAEGGKRQALDAGQAREVLAKIRRILGNSHGVDLYELIAWETVTMRFYESADYAEYESLRVYPSIRFVPKRIAPRKKGK